MSDNLQSDLAAHCMSLESELAQSIALNTKLGIALELSLDDSYEVLNDMITKYGENYRQDRIAYQRNYIAQVEELIKEFKERI